jgi:hypothetical protein
MTMRETACNLSSKVHPKSFGGPLSFAEEIGVPSDDLVTIAISNVTVPVACPTVKVVLHRCAGGGCGLLLAGAATEMDAAEHGEGV